MEQRIPNDLKAVAIRFTKIYYPQWISRVDRIWHMLEKVDFESIRLETTQSHQGNALGIGGAEDPQYSDYMSVISILAYVDQKPKNKDSIDKNEIIVQITSAPEGLKISNVQQQKLTNVLGEIFFSPVKKDVEVKKEIIFTETEIVGLYKKPIGKTYPFVLVENIILKKRIHWLWGFVIFGEWACGELIHKLPRDQFFNYKSKILKDIEKKGLKIAFNRGGDELWIKDYEAVKANLKCNLFEAIDNYNTAVIELEKGNINKAIEKLKIAISPPRYSNVKYIDAYNLLIQCIFKSNYQNISESLLEKIKIFLRWYKTKLGAAVFIIKNTYVKKNIISESRIEHELKELETEFGITKKNLGAIIKKVPVTEAENNYDELISLFQSLNETYERIIEVDEFEGEIIYDIPEFKTLKDNRLISKLFKMNITKLNELMPYSTDKEGTEAYLLLNIIKKGIDTDRGYDLPSMAKHLSNKLEYEINRMRNSGKRFAKEITGYDMDKIRLE
jgi:hypothetical protein